MGGNTIDYKTFCTDRAAGVTKDEVVASEETTKRAIVTELNLLVEENGDDRLRLPQKAGDPEQECSGQSEHSGQPEHSGEPEQEHVGDPYDDVYRTLLEDCPQLLIPLVNEIFNEHFTKEDQVVFSKDVHMTKGQTGEPSRRTTDSSFEIIGIVRKKYLIEEQTRLDNSILIRLFEYAVLVARDTASLDGNVLKVEFPNCAVLYLQSTKNTPNKMRIESKAPTGVLPIDVLVMKLRDYTLDDMIEKDLLFLFPFYLFRFSDYILAKCDQDTERLEPVRNDYRRMREHLNRLAVAGGLNEFYKYTIINMCNVVVENLARKYPNVVKGVQSVMGGKVIETEAKRILNAGKQEGRLEERENTERERRRADAAEQEAYVERQKNSILQEELEKVKQQLREVLLQKDAPKLVQQ